MRKLPQSSAIPYRVRDGMTEFLLITSLKGNWIFPKGIVEPGDRVVLTAGTAVNIPGSTNVIKVDTA